jgi:hypothetical protein
MAYSSSTLAFQGAWSTSPNQGEAGVWAAGGGPAGDGLVVYFSTGNGIFDVNTGGVDYGYSIVKLSAPSGGTFSVSDYFTPRIALIVAKYDRDLGSGGVLLLPDQPMTSRYPHLLLTAGKQGSVYLVNRDDMGKFSDTRTDKNVQTLPKAVNGLWGTPAWWNNTVYIGAQMDYLKAFRFNPNTELLSTAPVSQSTTFFTYPGPTPSVSSNGTSNGILWAIDTGGWDTSGPAILRAYDATDLSHELYDSNQNPARDSPSQAVKFTVPTVANGKVYVGSLQQISVYGLLSASK